MIILEYDIMMIMLYNNDVNLLPVGVAHGMAGSTSTLLIISCKMRNQELCKSWTGFGTLEHCNIIDVQWDFTTN